MFTRKMASATTTGARMRTNPCSPAPPAGQEAAPKATSFVYFFFFNFVCSLTSALKTASTAVEVSAAWLYNPTSRAGSEGGR